jgi:hypothetical protein
MVIQLTPGTGDIRIANTLIEATGPVHQYPWPLQNCYVGGEYDLRKAAQSEQVKCTE